LRKDDVQHDRGRACHRPRRRGIRQALPDRLPTYALPGSLNKPPHQPHLENFFAAIRGEAKLNCDARTAFLSEAPVYSINSAARNRQIIDFTADQLTP
jgi:hypothetical protein